jgi:hypothetical protein
MLQVVSVGRDSAVSIVSRYGLDGPGIEPLWGARYSSPVQTSPGAHTTCCKMGIGSLFWGIKRSGRGLDHRSPSSHEVKERVNIPLLSPLGLPGVF